MPTPTNEMRAERAEDALQHFQGDEIDDPGSVLVDLLADLIHLCAQKQWDFERCLDWARRHFEDESAEQPEEVAA
jgi:hypothetical protein